MSKLTHIARQCAVLLSLIGVASASAAAPVILFGPTPYLSTSQIPVGFYQGGSPTHLEDFESGRLAAPLRASTGSVINSKQWGTLVDSVDADDGSVDGSGFRGHSWFASRGITFTALCPEVTLRGPQAALVADCGLAPTAFGVVWTDGSGVVTFSATDRSGNSLGSWNFNNIGDGRTDDTTAEDRFIGLQYAGGIGSITISNTGGAIEVDHVQFGDMAVANSEPPANAIPEPASLALVMASLMGLGLTRARSGKR